jgi:hypothetical protein
MNPITRPNGVDDRETLTSTDVWPWPRHKKLERSHDRRLP